MSRNIGGIVDRIANRVARLPLGSRFDIRLDHPIVSFSFDDAPLSAAPLGAPILERHGARGTYYLAGRFFDDVEAEPPFMDGKAAQDLASRGHELACHTFAHRRLRDYSGAALRDDLADNEQILAGLDGGGGKRSFAIPYTMAWPPATLAMRSRYTTIRGGRAGINGTGTDFTNLKSVELRELPGFLEAAEYWLERQAEERGWLIFFTHHVADATVPFSITPEALERLVERTQKMGFAIRTVAEAYAESTGTPA